MYAAGALFHELYAGIRHGGRATDLTSYRALNARSGTRSDGCWMPTRWRRPEAREAIELVDRRRAGRAAAAGGAEEREDDGSFDWDNCTTTPTCRKGSGSPRSSGVRAKLGQGRFGVVYRVFNTLDDTDEVLKIMTGGGVSVEERLRGEYRILRQLPPHPNLVPLIDAEWLPKGGFPYLRMEFEEGQDLQAVIGGDGRRSGGRERPLGPADVRRLLEDCLAGLAHLHANLGVYHCARHQAQQSAVDPDGTKLLHFNAAVSAGSTLTPTLARPSSSRPVPWGVDGPLGGGPHRSRSVRTRCLRLHGAHRCVPVGADGRARPRTKEAPIPPDIAGFADLSPAFAAVLRRAISPRCANGSPTPRRSSPRCAQPVTYV